MTKEVNVTIRMDQITLEAIEAIKNEKGIQSTSRVIRYALIMAQAILAIQDVTSMRIEDLTKIKIEKLIRKLRALASAIEREEDDLEKIKKTKKS